MDSQQNGCKNTKMITNDISYDIKIKDVKINNITIKQK